MDSHSARYQSRNCGPVRCNLLLRLHWRVLNKQTSSFFITKNICWVMHWGFTVNFGAEQIGPTYSTMV